MKSLSANENSAGKILTPPFEILFIIALKH
jgi:hypothetical protein